MVNDTISDALTRIRNANLIKSPTVVLPNTKMVKNISLILLQEGFFSSCEVEANNTLVLRFKYSNRKSCLTGLKKVSKPGLRVYVNHRNLPKVLGGMGIAILSTSKGIMTDREARFYCVGGEVLCHVW
uniref:Small ribosomal subunit protein uS8c n=1 Tax=Picocystis salinarum TaxID=88271 RepID=A0A088CIE2_9CHLO|nr:ribosomal protein S8 [Picocystis salinarum]AID67650.1 ribosomal protein S8 [Picocystis salinarum]